MIPDPRFRLRTATRAELNTLIAWAAAQGWNPGLYDGDAFWAADPNGYLLAEMEGEPEPWGCISAVRYGPDFGFIGFLIVKPEHRGGSSFVRLSTAALEHLSGCRTVGLDGVFERQDLYEKGGFTFSHRNLRYRGQNATTGAGPTAPGIVALSRVPWSDVLAYDRRHFPSPRLGFLQYWVRQPCSLALAATGPDGRVVGYGVIRPCREGFKIGPLFADNSEIASQLLDALSAHAGNAPFYLDTPENNPAAVALATSRKMEMVFGTARMYTGGFPDLAHAGIYGVTSFELG